MSKPSKDAGHKYLAAQRAIDLLSGKIRVHQLTGRRVVLSSADVGDVQELVDDYCRLRARAFEMWIRRRGGK